MVISTVAHVGMGALLLATTVILTIRVWLIASPSKIGITLMPNWTRNHGRIRVGRNREEIGEVTYRA
jgi:hypothetical protein